MCQASLEGWKTRPAVEGETVYAVRDHYGAFSEKPNTYMHTGMTKLVCVKNGQKMTIENLQVSSALPVHIKQAKIGKTHIVTLISASRRRWSDNVQFEDGYCMPSQFVTSPMYVGIKLPEHKLFRGRKQFDAHLDKWPPSKVGVKAIEKSIAEALATTPDEKPAKVGFIRRFAKL